jgi:hypothetical protein
MTIFESVFNQLMPVCLKTRFLLRFVGNAAIDQVNGGDIPTFSFRMMNFPGLTPIQTPNLAFSHFQRGWFGFVADPTVRKSHCVAPPIWLPEKLVYKVRDAKEGLFNTCLEHRFVVFFASKYLNLG